MPTITIAKEKSDLSMKKTGMSSMTSFGKVINNIDSQPKQFTFGAKTKSLAPVLLKLPTITTQRLEYPDTESEKDEVLQLPTT